MTATVRFAIWIALPAAVAAAGCSGGAMPGKATPAEVEAARGKLDPADRVLADEQEWCVVSTKMRLGSMGVPVKVAVKGRAVFLCCDHCEKRAMADPEKTLASLEANRKRAAEERAAKKE